MHKTDLSKQLQYFILLKNCQAVECKHKIIVGQTKTEINVLAGSLWQSKKHFKGNDKIFEIYSAARDTNLFMQVNRKHIGCISTIQFKLLLAITTCSDRLEVYKSKSNKLKMTEYIREISKQNHPLYIPIVLHEDDFIKLNGHLKFIGRCPERIGLWLGINLDEPYTGRVFDTKSVIYDGKPIFPCIKNHAVFANISQISYLKDLEYNLEYNLKNEKLVSALHNYPMIPMNSDIDDDMVEIPIGYKDMAETIKKNSSDKNSFVSTWFNKDIDDLTFIEDVILNRNYYTVPSIKMATQTSNIKDEKFWKFQEEYSEKDIYSSNESRNQLTVPSVKSKKSPVVKVQQIFEQKGWSSANDIKKRNSSPNIISREFYEIPDKDNKIVSDIKKEKSTDCDSALIPPLCVHG